MQWSDGTSLDYIMNTVNTGCVTLYFNNEYKWNDVDCNEVHNFICNMPSETCNHGYITYNWYNVSGEMEQNKCEMNINNGNNEEYNNNNIMGKHYTKWTAEDIISWLTELENGKFKKYSNLLGKFQEEEVCG
eukprot:795526_1